ncbi:hypothetical protein pb186bvf_001611 [Paramecium bursaria]
MDNKYATQLLDFILKLILLEFVESHLVDKLKCRIIGHQEKIVFICTNANCQQQRGLCAICIQMELHNIDLNFKKNQIIKLSIFNDELKDRAKLQEEYINEYEKQIEQYMTQFKNIQEKILLIIQREQHKLNDLKENKRILDQQINHINQQSIDNRQLSDIIAFYAKPQDLKKKNNKIQTLLDDINQRIKQYDQKPIKLIEKEETQTKKNQEYQQQQYISAYQSNYPQKQQNQQQQNNQSLINQTNQQRINPPLLISQINKQGGNHSILPSSKIQEPDYKQCKQLVDHNQNILIAQISPNNMMIASSDAENILLLWNTIEVTADQKYAHKCNLKALCFSSDSKFLYAGDDHGFIIVFDLNIGLKVKCQKQINTNTIIAIFDTGKNILVQLMNGYIYNCQLSDQQIKIESDIDTKYPYQSEEYLLSSRDYCNSFDIYAFTNQKTIYLYQSFQELSVKHLDKYLGQIIFQQNQLITSYIDMVEIQIWEVGKQLISKNLIKLDGIPLNISVFEQIIIYETQNQLSSFSLELNQIRKITDIPKYQICRRFYNTRQSRDHHLTLRQNWTDKQFPPIFLQKKLKELYYLRNNIYYFTQFIFYWKNNFQIMQFFIESHSLQIYNKNKMYQSEMMCPIQNHNKPIDRICTFQLCNEAVKTICAECSHQNYHLHGFQQKPHQIKISDYYAQLSQKLNQKNQEFKQINDQIVQQIKTLERLKQDQEKIIQLNYELSNKIQNNQINQQEIQKSLTSYNNSQGQIILSTNLDKISKFTQILNNNQPRMSLGNQNNLNSVFRNTHQEVIKSQLSYKFDCINAVAICREKNYVAVGDNKSLKIISLKQNMIFQNIDLGEQINCLCYSLRENQLLIGFENGQIGLYAYDNNCELAEKFRFNYQKISIQRVIFISSEQICSINQNGILELINLKETNIKNQVIRNVEFNQKSVLKPICHLNSCNLRKILIASKGGYLLCWQIDKVVDNYIITKLEEDSIGLIQINSQYIICSGFRQNKLYFYEINKQQIDAQIQIRLKMILQFDNQILSFYLGIGIGCQLFMDLQGKIQVLELDKFRVNVKDEYELMYSDQIYNTTQPNLLDYLLVTRGKELIIFKR